MGHTDEQSALLRRLHDRERTIEHLAQANYALHDELDVFRAIGLDWIPPHERRGRA